jgi:hypothetical protein
MKPKHEHSVEASHFAGSELVDRLYARYKAPVGLIDVGYGQKKYAAIVNWLKNRFPLSEQLLCRSGSDGDSTIDHDSLILQNPPRSPGHLIQHSTHYQSFLIHPANNETQLRRVSITALKSREHTYRPDNTVKVRTETKEVVKALSSATKVNTQPYEKSITSGIEQQHSQTLTDAQTFFPVTQQMETDQQQKVPDVQSVPSMHRHQEAGAETQWIVRRPGLADLFQPVNNSGQYNAEPGRARELRKAAPSNPTPSNILPVKESEYEEFTRISRYPKIKKSDSTAAPLPVLTLNTSKAGVDGEIRDNSPKPISTQVQYPELELKPKWLEFAGGKSEQMNILRSFTHAADQELTSKSGYKADTNAMIWRNDREKVAERADTSKEEMYAQDSETFKMDPDTVRLIENRSAPRLETRDIRFSKREWAQLIETLSQVVWKKLLIDFERRGIRVWR